MAAASWLIFAALAVSSTRAYSAGPPESASVCDRMTPGHGPDGQTGDSPFQLEASVSAVDAGATVDLTLSSKSSKAFKGFMVVARDAATNSRVGTFESSSDVRPMDCDSVPNSAASHLNGDDKTSVKLKWTAPNVETETLVEFKYTAVEQYNTFWVAKPANGRLTVRPGSGSGGPEAEGVPKTEPEPEPEDVPLHENYDGCGSTKGCFGTTFDNGDTGCVTAGNCKAMVTYSKTADDNFEVTLHGYKIAANNFVAVGLSNDASMGEDLVFSCSETSADPLRVGWNVCGTKSNEKAALKEAITSTKTVKDSVTTCTFIIPKKLTVEAGSAWSEAEYDVESSDYHLLLASGPMSDGENLGYHGPTNRKASDKPVDLKRAAIHGASGLPNLVKAHASLMVLAWMAFASIGTAMARHFRNTWPHIRPGNKDLWFRVHQLCMGLTVLVSLIALIVIVCHAGWFPYDGKFLAENPHPAVGLASLVLAFIQPIMALFRPPPDGKWRWVFNISHSFVGNSAYLLAIVAIFFALEMTGLRPSYSYGLIAFLVGHVSVHLVLINYDFYKAKNFPTQPDSKLVKSCAGAFYLLFVATYAIVYVVLFGVS